MSKKQTSASNKAYFTKYKAEGLAKLHQNKKLAKHMKTHANDMQSIEKPAVNYKKKGG